MSIFVPLFVPANRSDRFDKAAMAGATAVILDLEDAIAENDKLSARASLRRVAGVTNIVRINGIGTRWHDGDVAALSELRPDLVMIPKSEAGAPFYTLLSRLPTPAVALVETAKGMETARELAQCAGVVRLAFGSVDYCADLGCAHIRAPLLAARSEVVLASRLANLEAPLDGVTVSVGDSDATRSDARYASELGFGGKMAIHPRQIAWIREGFRPDEAEIDWALKVLGCLDGLAVVEGTMVDEPVRIRARAILDRA